jgi:hypothetical protein
MDAQRVIDIALCFDVAIFGGYIRDIVIAGQTKYNDIDIMWPVGTHGSFTNFVRLLALDGAKVTTRNMPKSKYQGLHLIKVSIDDSIHLDCVMYPGKLVDWLRDDAVDFTCNLFYRTREVPLALRYIPEAYKFDPNPVRTLMELTKDRKFRTVLTKIGDRYWSRAANRALSLVNRGWFLDGEFMSEYYEDRLQDAFNPILRTVDHINDKMKRHALAVLDETGLTSACKERVRLKLFDSESEEVASTQVSETDDA